MNWELEYKKRERERWLKYLFAPPPDEAARRARGEKAFLLRDGGAAYRQVGAAIGGVTASRAVQIVGWYRRVLRAYCRWWLREPDWPEQLPHLLEAPGMRQK